MKKLQKGFTLIELLVVIAIIGILSGIVLASLSSARSRGTDAAIQSTLSNMRPQAELLFTSISSYGSTITAADCATTGGLYPNSIFGTTTQGSLRTLTADLITKAGGAANTRCAALSTAWVAAARTSTGSACADSTGVSKTSASTTLATVVNNAGFCN